MTPGIDGDEKEPYCIFTEEEAGWLVFEALDTSPDEPEPLIKLLRILHDHAGDHRLQESIYLLMRMAYNGSIVHSIDFQEYLEAIKQGRNPLEEARARWCGGQESED